MYELIAESCIPGINTTNYDLIFEEQIVMQSLSTNNKMIDQVESNIFCVEDKTFYFGSTIPNKESIGIFERFKIQNNKKIPCTVNFEI